MVFILMIQFFLNDYPDFLKNKVMLFIEFKKFLEEETINKKIDKDKNNISPEKRKSKEARDLEKSKSKENIGSDFSSVEIKESDFIFVKKWMNTKHAIIFRFSNKIIQTIFKDKTQIFIHSLNNSVTYINKKEEKLEFPLNAIFDSNNYEMIRRVRYVKEVLAHMVNINKKKLEKNDDDNIKEGSKTKE